MTSVPRGPRSHRIHLDQPLSLVEAATACADTAGHPLSSFVHAAIISAVRAAETGRGNLLPKQGPRKRGTAPADVGRIAITASREDRARWSAALEAHGSSILAVVGEALSAFVASGGSWADTPMPGEPRQSWQESGAA